MPLNERVPGSGFNSVAPERIAVVPDRQVTARHAISNHPPGSPDIACEFEWEIPPETLPLERGTHIHRRADMRVMDIEMLRGVMRIRTGGEQEFADVPLPPRASVNQFMSDNEYRLAFDRQDQRHQDDFPQDQMPHDEDLPKCEHECQGPKQRPEPDR